MKRVSVREKREKERERETVAVVVVIAVARRGAAVLIKCSQVHCDIPSVVGSVGVVVVVVSVPASATTRIW